LCYVWRPVVLSFCVARRTPRLYALSLHDALPISPVVRDGVVYTGSSDATAVYAIDASTGERRWKTSVPGYAWARTAMDECMVVRSEEHTSELQSRENLVCRLLLEKKNKSVA